MIDDCDGCPDDPEKISPGLCGCGVSDIDSDFDTVPDCNDRCPGQNDLIETDLSGTPDCLEPGVIPAVSEWGMIVLTILVLTAGTIVFSRWKRPTAA